MRQNRFPVSFLFAAISAAVAVGGCHDESATGLEVLGTQFAEVQSQDPDVIGTDPPGAPQDTTLDVVVSGSGFEDGSTVQLTLGGVPTDKVRTNWTRYRSPKKLISNITIAADAQIDFYDVEVTTLSHKKGIGTEIFEVSATGENEVLVEFRQTPSAELADFFSPGVTLDYVSPPQRLQGKHNENSVDTKLSPFTLGLEAATQLYDGLDPNSDPACETEFLESILAAAVANGGSLEGSLEITAQWDHPVTTVIAFNFEVAVGDYEYRIDVPLGGDVGLDRVVELKDAYTILAIRNGHFQVRRRELGRKGTWWEMQRCLITSEPNGPLDFEIWVWR